MSDELKAAVERLRANDYKRPCDTHFVPTQKYSDLLLIRDAYLKEHPKPLADGKDMGGVIKHGTCHG